MRTTGLKKMGLLVVLLVLPKFAMAATATAQALANVIAQLTITKERDLNFGDLVAGSVAVPVPADPSEVRAAKFMVAGQPNAEFNITLPADGSVIMRTAGGGSPETEIGVNTFASLPATRGTIDPAGSAELFVGATSADLLPTQAQGGYTGDFVVEVVYP